MLMPQVMDGQEYMTTAEAASFLGIATKTFRAKYVNKGSNLFIRELRQKKDPLDTRKTLYLISDLEEIKGTRPK